MTVYAAVQHLCIEIALLVANTNRFLKNILIKANALARPILWWHTKIFFSVEINIGQ